MVNLTAPHKHPPTACLLLIAVPPGCWFSLLTGRLFATSLAVEFVWDCRPYRFLGIVWQLKYRTVKFLHQVLAGRDGWIKWLFARW